MNDCGCIHRIEAGLKEKLSGAQSVSCDGIELLSGKTFTGFMVKTEGQKREKSYPVYHSFCPWCGKPYEEKEARA